MGQIFDRLKNFIKSELNSERSFSSPEYTQEELEKIIDELNQGSFEDLPNDQYETKSTVSQSTKMDYKKACEILEIPVDADIQTIQNSYRKLIKEYHPDKVQNLGKEIRLLAEKKTIEINQAYEYIRKIKNF